MDKTVPVGAAILLDFIRESEVARLDLSAIRPTAPRHEAVFY